MSDRAPLPYDFMPQVPSFTLESTDVADGQQMGDNQVYNGFGIPMAEASKLTFYKGAGCDTCNG